MSAEYEGKEDPMTGVPKLLAKSRPCAGNTRLPETPTSGRGESHVQSPNAFASVGRGSGLAGRASGVAASRVCLGANDRIRFGLIGAGGRGQEIFRAALRCPERRGRRRGRCLYAPAWTKPRALPRQSRRYRDFRRLLDDKSIDAVLIATPATPARAELRAGDPGGQRRVSREDHGVQSRARPADAQGVCQGSGRVVQVGMQMNSAPGIAKIQEWSTPDRLGAITAIQAHHYRNAPYGGWLRAIPPDCDAAARRLAGLRGRRQAPRLRSAALRELAILTGITRAATCSRTWSTRWRSGSRSLGLNIPETVTMAGGNYPLAQDGGARYDVGVHEPSGEASLHLEFHVRQRLLRRDARLPLRHQGHRDCTTNPTRCCTIPRAGTERRGSEAVQPRAVTLDYDGPAHAELLRLRAQPQRAESAPSRWDTALPITCQMAIASCRQQRTVRWDPQAQDIV